MEKILYTRCSPWIDLLNQGKIVRQEGFGVAAISPNLFSAPINFRLLKRIIEDRKGDMNQFEKIYEYVEVGNGQYAFVCSGELPLCTELRKNGGGHRPIFMAEALIGSFAKNPAAYMNAENFPGDQKSQNDYYRLDLGIDTPPFELTAENEENLAKTDVFFSLGPDRKRNLTAILSYLLEELKKPEAQRTVLFIKDSNEEVIGYINTVAQLLPASLSSKLTFLTHTSSFKSNPERYSYYNMSPIGEVMEYNPYVDAALKANRRLKYQVVGFTQGSLMHNPRSEFHLLDGKTGQTTFPVNAGVFVTALASGDPSARKCIAFINENMGGVLPNDVDNFYEFYRSVLVSSGTPSKSDLERSINFYLSSGYNMPAIKSSIINLIKDNYKAMLSEDMASSFSLYKLAGRVDPSLSQEFFPLIKAHLYSLLDAMPSNELISVYNTLKGEGLLASIENDILQNHIRGDVLYQLSKGAGNDAVLNFYFDLYQQKVKKGLEGKLSENDELKVLHAYAALMRKNANNPAVLQQIDALLVPFGARREQVYRTIVLEAYKDNNQEQIDTFIRMFRPNMGYKETMLTIASFIKEMTFGQFEGKLVKAYLSDKSRGAEYIDTLFALFEHYPNANRPELNSGLVFAKTFIEGLGEQVEPNALRNALDFLLRLKGVRGSIPEELAKELEMKLMKYVLQGGSLTTFEAPLKELAIEKPALLSKVKDDVVKAQTSSDQKKVLEEFAAKGGYLIKPADLRLPYFVSILRALNYEKSLVHIAFLCAFAPGDPKGLLASYIKVLQELRKSDGMMLYYSLCLVVSFKSDNGSVKAVQEAVEALIKPKDNPTIEACYDKRYEKRLKELPEDNEIYKAAKARLVADFQEYGKSHKGGLFSWFKR